jgi:hypothetical protein
MNRKRILILIVIVSAVALLIFAGTALAGSVYRDITSVSDYDPNLRPKVPREMNYQGVLRDSSGVLIDGEHDLTFTIYRWSTIFGWSPVYEEIQPVLVDDGLFNVTIGSVNPITPTLFTGPTAKGGALQLGISVDGGTELAPRIDLLTVPYAFRSEYVDRHPAPHYDSGWEFIGPRPDPVNIEFTHLLGGDPDDYVVDLQCKGDEGINDCTFGYLGNVFTGAYWHDLTVDSIWVWVDNWTDPDELRVRIWRIE